MLLTAVSWTGLGDGTNWSDPDNWSGHSVPGTVDDVTIAVAGNPMVSITSAQAVKSLQLSDTVSLGAGGSLALTAASQVTASGTLTLAGGTLVLDAITLSNLGTVRVQADSTIDRGAVSYGTLDNKGTLLHLAGNLRLLAKTSILNEGVYNFTADGTSIGNAGSSFGTLANTATGLVEKTAGAGTSSIGQGATFYNQGGTVLAHAGTLSLGAGTSTGGIYNADAGAVIDLTGGESVAWSGTFSGSGEGTVQLAQGQILLGGFTTFNFFAGLFQFTGGDINLSGKTLMNIGAMNIATSGSGLLGSLSTTHNLGGTLDNLGTIIQSAGTFTLSDGVTLDNEAIFGINGDASLAVGTNNLPTVTNEVTGLFVKTAGVGTSAIGAGITFDNQGTVTATSGSFSFPTTVLQVSGNTLAGGSWNAVGTGSLVLPGGNFSINQGSVMLSGAGQFAQITTLAQNDGTFSLLGGRSFTTVGPLTSNGRLVIGPGSTLSVTGALSLGNTSNLTIQVGGSPGSGLFGKTTSSAGNTIHGTLNVQLVNGFFPLPGQVFPIIVYPSAAGGFATINGLSSGGNIVFTAAQNPLNFTLTGVAIPAPRVTNVLVAGTNWSAAYLSYLQNQGLGSGGYSIPVGSSAQLKALPWVNLNQIQIVFSQDVAVQADSLILAGAAVPTYAVSDFGYDHTSHTATWTLGTTIDQDKLLIDLGTAGPSAVVNLQGTALDGDWTNASSHYPSGNGTPGGDFLFRFNVLPADANQDGTVNGLDISLAASNWLQTGGKPGDVNGDNIVNGLDISAIASHWLDHFSSVPGDVNNDGVTNGLDISLVAAHWLAHSPAGDANNDGVVNGLDLALIASNWLVSGGASAAASSSATAAVMAVSVATTVTAKPQIAMTYDAPRSEHANVVRADGDVRSSGKCITSPDNKNATSTPTDACPAEQTAGVDWYHLYSPQRRGIGARVLQR